MSPVHGTGYKLVYLIFTIDFVISSKNKRVTLNPLALVFLRPTMILYNYTSIIFLYII